MNAELKEAIEVILAVEKRILSTVNDRISHVEARLIPLETKVSRIEETVLDIQEDLAAALEASDRHSLQLFDHQKRIGRLEKKKA